MWIEDVLLTSVPTSLGDLSSLTNLQIRKCPKLERLPDSLGCLSSLEKFYIEDCPVLKCLPDSLGDLPSLTDLTITHCLELEVKSLAKAIRQLSNLRSLRIWNCPISGSSLSFGSSSLKDVYVGQTEVCRISCSPHLESLHLKENHHLEEIEALPRTLREFHLIGWNRIEKIEGIENCTGVETLTVESRMEVPGIESLEHLRNLRELQLTANKLGPVIERCIQRMQEWPSETTIICARAVPDAASLVQSLLSPNLQIVDSISNQKLQFQPKLTRKRFSHGEALMLCFVINCVSSQTTLDISDDSRCFEKGRWAWVGVFTQRSSERNDYTVYREECREEDDVDAGEYGEEDDMEECEEEDDVEIGEGGEEDEVEKGLAVMGEEGTLMEAFRSLVPLLFQS